MAQTKFRKWKIEQDKGDNYILQLYYTMDNSFFLNMLDKTKKKFTIPTIENNNTFKVSNIEHGETLYPVIELQIKRQIHEVENIIGEPDTKNNLPAMKLLNNGVSDVEFKKDGNKWDITVFVTGQFIEKSKAIIKKKWYNLRG